MPRKPRRALAVSAQCDSKAHATNLREILHHERDVLLGLFDTRLGTRMRRFKREPAFESTRLDDGERFRPIDGHRPVGLETPWMLLQQVPLFDQLSAVLEVHLADTASQD